MLTLTADAAFARPRRRTVGGYKLPAAGRAGIRRGARVAIRVAAGPAELHEPKNRLLFLPTERKILEAAERGEPPPGVGC